MTHPPQVNLDALHKTSHTAATQTLTMQQVLQGVFETVMEGIEKDIKRWKGKARKARQLEDILHCQRQTRHFEGLRSHMRKGLFDLQDQVTSLPAPNATLEQTVQAVLKLVLDHQQGYSGAGARRPPAPGGAAGHP